jgi:hypothetical protein
VLQKDGTGCCGEVWVRIWIVRSAHPTQNLRDLAPSVQCRMWGGENDGPMIV